MATDASQLTFSAADDGDWATAPGEVDAALDELADRAFAIERFWDGAVIETISITVTSAGGVISLNLEQGGGGNLTFLFAGKRHILDTTPAVSVTLTAGTDTAPTLNYIYVLESAGVLTLTNSTASFPTGAHAPVATVMCQSAASLSTDGAYKVHAWTDHINSSGANGHLSHLNKKIRAFEATWESGVAPSDMTNGQCSTTAGVVFQLHTHTMPARDMAAADPLFVVNDNATAYKRITDMDGGGVDSMSDGSGFTNNEYGNFVLIGVVNEAEADCKLYLTLPSGSYNTAGSAQTDTSNTAVYSIGSDFVGTAFLIARYTLQFTAGGGGSWAQSLKTDLRGLQPSTSPGGGAAGTDHNNLVDNAIIRGDGTSAVQGSGVLIDDSDDISGVRVITAASYLSLQSAAGNNAITVTGGSSSGGTGSSVAISAGSSSGSDGDGGTVSLTAGGKHGSGTEGAIKLIDHGAVTALEVTSDATPTITLNRALVNTTSVTVASGTRLGTGTADEFTFITGTSWALKVNNVATLTLSDVLHDFKSVPTQNHERLFTLAYGDNTPRTSSSWLRGPGYVTNSASKGLGAPWAVTIVGAWCRTNITTATSGSVTAEVYINNVVKSAADLVFPQADGTGWATQYISGLSIAAGVGDYIHIGMTESGTMAWDDTQYVLYCKAIV